MVETAGYFSGDHIFSSALMIFLLSAAFVTISLVPFWANPSFWRREDDDDKQVELDDRFKS